MFSTRAVRRSETPHRCTPKFLFHPDRIDQIAPAAAGRIGVRAAGNKIQRAKKEEEALQRKPPISINNLMN
jgi:hypothetical protein